MQKFNIVNKVKNLIKNYFGQILQIIHTIKYNLLSLLNVGLGFIFVVMLGRSFGVGENTDIYFSSVIIITYLGSLVKTGNFAIQQYYLEIKESNVKLAFEIYTILILQIVLVSILLISLYFIINNIYQIFNYKTTIFMNIFIFYILFFNILSFNKIILSLEKFYSSIYIVDILVNIVNILVLYFFAKEGIIAIAFSMIGAALLAVLWQFYLVYFKIGNSMKLGKFSNKKNFLVLIIRDSFKFNLGAIVYNLKDPMLISAFSQYGVGIYSLYSYANKFAGIIMQVVNAPIVNIFITDCSNIVVRKKYELLNNFKNKLLFKIILLLLLSSLFIYLILPFIFEYFFNFMFNYNQITTLEEIYLYLIIFYLLGTIAIPYNIVLNFFKEFELIFYLKLIFIISLGLGYIIIYYCSMNFKYVLLALIFAQFITTLFFIHYYSKKLNYQLIKSKT